jgi:hypothetical protein
MIRHNETSDIELKKRIKQNEICFGENVKPRIYRRVETSMTAPMQHSCRYSLI